MSLSEKLKVMKEKKGDMEMNDEGIKIAVNQKLIDETETFRLSYLNMMASFTGNKEESLDKKKAYLRAFSQKLNCQREAEELISGGDAMTIEEIETFLDECNTKNQFLYFILDTVSYIKLGEDTVDLMENLTDLGKLGGLSHGEIQAFSPLSEAFINRDYTAYGSALEYAPKKIQEMDFTCYLRGWYEGMTVNTSKEKYFALEERVQLGILDGVQEFTERKVTFENLHIVINDDWNFSRVEKVSFINCLIEGKDHSLKFKNVGDLYMEGCIVRNFENRFAEIESLDNLELINNEFIDCGAERAWLSSSVYHGRYSYGDCTVAEGGVFKFGQAVKEISSIAVEGNVVQNCYIKCLTEEADDTYRCSASGAFIGFLGGEKTSIDSMEVNNNSFIGCRCELVGEDVKRDENYESIISLAKITTKNADGNTFTVGVKRLFER